MDEYYRGGEDLEESWDSKTGRGSYITSSNQEGTMHEHRNAVCKWQVGRMPDSKMSSLVPGGEQCSTTLLRPGQSYGWKDGHC